jgi:hypothetical protein
MRLVAMFSNLTVSGNRKAVLTGNPTPRIALVRASILAASSARAVCLSGAALFFKLVATWGCLGPRVFPQIKFTIFNL